jgi:hypothetical protein
MSSAKRYLKSIGRRSLFMTTSPIYLEPTSSPKVTQLTSSAEGSHVRTSHQQEEEQDSAEPVQDCDLSSADLSASCNPLGLSSKMSQCFALEDWTRYSGASLRSGMMRSGTVFPLPPLVPLTKGTGSGLWPTPQASDSKNRGHLGMPAVQRRLSIGKQLNLSMVVSNTSGNLNPQWVEWLMGFPNDHTA